MPAWPAASPRASPCWASPLTPTPTRTRTSGTPIAGKAPLDLYAGVGADAFAELSNNFVSQYNAQNPAPTKLLESYDAVNPVTGATGPGENIATKPGCSGIPRPNGANAGINAIALNQKSTVDPTAFCIDWVRSSRSKGTAATDAALTFYAQSRDAVGYAVIGNAYAPTTPLTTAQLKDIFECPITDWSQVGGQPGPIHVYRPPTTRRDLHVLPDRRSAPASPTVTPVAGLPARVANSQQNDGTTMNGDPLGIAPYTVTKWAAQSNADLGPRRGRHLRQPRRHAHRVRQHRPPPRPRTRCSTACTTRC